MTSCLPHEKKRREREGEGGDDDSADVETARNAGGKIHVSTGISEARSNQTVRFATDTC